MTTEKVTLKNVSDAPTVVNTESTTVTTTPKEVKGFNSSNISPFTNGGLTVNVPAQAQTPAPGLFGNKVLGTEETLTKTEPQPQQEASEAAKVPFKNPIGSFGVLSNFLKKCSSPFKEAGQKVNEYDAAVNNALKYLPGSGDMQILVESNPRITAIMNEAGLPLNMNYDNLKTIKHTHIATTVAYARAIGEDLGLSEEELKTMEAGAALHDVGKSLIPAEVLNKNGRLDANERRIINYHSILGYEILKSAGYGVDVAEIARDHHNPNSTNKYAQIVRAADVYSAMREERPYKTAKTHEQAMSVLNDMKISKNILCALDTKFGEFKSNFGLPTQSQVSVA